METRYFNALLHQESDSAFGLTFPDVPGCIAAADSLDGTVSAGQEALSLWFEDRLVVAPEDIHAVRLKDEVQAALSNGAVLVSIPFSGR